MLLLVLALMVFVTNQAAQPVAPGNVTRARAALTALAARDAASIEAQFTDPMKAAWPPGRLATMWAALVDQAGAHDGCASEPRVVSIADKQMVITRCQFERAAFDVQFAFDTAGKISGFTIRPAAAPAPYAPPSYVDPAAYTEEAVTIGRLEWGLPGTLAMPAGGGNLPAVILVHGSGPGDRDTTIGPNKPFKDIALGLASRGTAVLRYDKRSRVLHGRQMAPSPSMTVKEEVIDDVGEAIAVLRARARINAARIFVLGHSLGGMLIPRIVHAHPSIAGAIVLAGAARPMEDAIVEQTRYLAMQDGTVTPDEQSQIDAAAKNATVVKALGQADVTAGTRVLGAPAGYWLDLRGYDPPSAARTLKVPLLVLQGERDYQVTMEEYARWKNALAGTTTATFRSYPALNHLFIAGTAKSLPAEYLIPSHVAEDVIRDIAAFINR